MSSISDWRRELGASLRFDNIQKIQKSIQSSHDNSSKETQKAAFAAEAEAFQDASSREAYDTIINALLEIEATTTTSDPPPSTPGITIGTFPNCHHIATGLTTEVYRSNSVALKVITQSHNITPHDPHREVQILKSLIHPHIIQFISTAQTNEHNLIIIFPYMPLTLATVLSSSKPPTLPTTLSIFQNLFSALTYLHNTHGIIHRDIKPSNLLLATPSGPAHLADFGTAWHPVLSLIPSASPSSVREPADAKILEVGTTCYRAPETLFGNTAYDTSLDMWSAGVVLAECVRVPPAPLFESRGGDEDGNQLGLLLSMFKTLGTPTRVTWPEAAAWKTVPWEWYREFEGRGWEELLPGVEGEVRGFVEGMVKWESGWRIKADEALSRVEGLISKKSEVDRTI